MRWVFIWLLLTRNSTLWRWHGIFFCCCGCSSTCWWFWFHDQQVWLVLQGTKCIKNKQFSTKMIHSYRVSLTVKNLIWFTCVHLNLFTDMHLLIIESHCVLFISHNHFQLFWLYNCLYNCNRLFFIQKESPPVDCRHKWLVSLSVWWDYEPQFLNKNCCYWTIFSLWISSIWIFGGFQTLKDLSPLDLKLLYPFFKSMKS